MNTFKSILLGVSVSMMSLMSAAGAFADTLSPKETYLKYHASLPAAQKIDDVSSFMCKKVVDEIAKTPADMKPMMFGFMKESSPHSVQVLSEDVKGDNATILLTAKSEPRTMDGNAVKEETKGKVTFVKEAGVWKIEKESWEVKTEVGGGPAPTPSAK